MLHHLLLLLPLLPQADPTEWTAEVDALLAAGRAEAAVLRLERHLDRVPEDAAAWGRLGETLEALGGEAGASPLIIEDARRAWGRAAELAPFDVAILQGAAALSLRTGAFRSAAERSARALGLRALAGGPPPAELAELHCRARIGLFQAVDPADGERWRGELEAAWDALAGARRAHPTAPGLVSVEAAWLDGLGLGDRASEVLAEALRALPGDEGLHRQLTDLHVREGVVAALGPLYERLAARGDRGMNGTLAWYTGYVARLQGDEAQRERRFDAALEAYGRAIEWMDAARLLEPAFEAGCAHVRVQSRVARVWCALARQELGAARDELLDVLGSSPQRKDTLDGLGRSAMDAASSLGDALVTRDRYEDAVVLARAVLAVAPDSGLWWNNLGFLLREYASQLESGALPGRQPDAVAAAPVYRESWRAYERAVELSPEDARIVNDAALIQVYHVREELELAEELLHRAVRLGESQLRALGPDAGEAQRFPIAQAVGDAYQNLGYLYYHLLDRPAEARPFWVASMGTDSGDRSSFQAYLDAIDGTGEPVEEPGVQASPPQAEDRLPEPAPIPWEASLDEALAAAGDGTLVLYQRGDGLGLLVPLLDRLVRGARFAERTAGAVVAVADTLRHNFVDRTTDGRRLPCPRWGAVTCAEHVAVAESFAAWHRGRFGQAPGEAEEGLWIGGHASLGGVEVETAPGALEPLAWRPALFGPEGGGLVVRPAPALDLLALEARALRDDAGPLVAVRRRAARELVEALLFDGTDGLRRRVVYALRRDEHQSARALLEAAVRQPLEPELALLVLEDWQGPPPEAARHVERWSFDPRVRAAARRILAAAPGDPGAAVQLAARAALTGS